MCLFVFLLREDSVLSVVKTKTKTNLSKLQLN